MAEFLSEHAIALRLVWFRVLCYFAVPWFVTFLGQTETWSDATWKETGWFLKVRLFMTCTVAGLAALVAFIDSAYGHAKQEVGERKKANDNTEFLKKQEQNG